MNRGESVKKVGIPLFLSLFFFLILVRVSLAATPITDCTDITSSGEYYLANDIVVNNPYCFAISDGITNVSIDMMGHKITINYNGASLFYMNTDFPINVTLMNGTLDTTKTVNTFNIMSDSVMFKLKDIDFVGDLGAYKFTTSTNANNLESAYWVYLEFLGGTSNVSATGEFLIKTYNLTRIFDSDVRRIEIHQKTYVYNTKTEEMNIDGEFHIYDSEIERELRFGDKSYYLSSSEIVNTSYCSIPIDVYENTSVDISSDFSMIFSKNSDLNIIGSHQPPDPFECYGISVVGYNSNITAETLELVSVVLDKSNFNVSDINPDLIVCNDSTIYSDYMYSGIIYLDECYMNIESSFELHLSGRVRDSVAEIVPPIWFDGITLDNVTIYNDHNLILANTPNKIHILDSFTQILNNGISITISGNVDFSFSQTMHHIEVRTFYSKEKSLLMFVDNGGTPGVTVTYIISGLKPNTLYNVYVDGNLVDSLFTDENGALSGFDVTYHSPVNITIEENRYLITDCTTIDSPGTYYLVNDIDASGYDVCINIQSDNVVLNGMGHKIYFPVNTTNKAAVGSGWQTNVTVKNLTVEYGEVAINGYNNTYEGINLYYGRMYTNLNSNNIILRNINFYEHPANGYENLDITDDVYNIIIENVYFNVTPTTFPVMFVRIGSHDIYIKNLTAIGDGINFDQSSIYNVVLDEYTFKWVDGSCLPIYGGGNGLVIKNSWIESGDGGDSIIFDSNNTIIENTNFIGGTNLYIKRCENITLRNLYADNSIIFQEWTKNVKILDNWVNLDIIFDGGWVENLYMYNNSLSGNILASATNQYMKNVWIENNSASFLLLVFVKNATVCRNTIQSYYISDWYYIQEHPFKSDGVYVGEQCKVIDSGIVAEDLSGVSFGVANNTAHSRNCDLSFACVADGGTHYVYDDTSFPIRIEYTNDMNTTIAHVLGPITINTSASRIYDTYLIEIDRNVISYTRELVKWVDNKIGGGSANITYRVCGLYPSRDYKLYIDGELNKTFTTDSNGCTPEFILEYHSPHEITIEASPTPPPKPTSFMKSLLGIGIVTSFLFFVLSLISSPEISVERLLKIIGIITAILILILTYGML